MSKYIIFGTGVYGKKAINSVGSINIDFFVDNDEKKQNKTIYSIPIYSPEKLKDIGNHKLVIALSDKYIEEVKKQVEKYGIFEYETLTEFKHRQIREKILSRINYIEIYNRCINWIKNNTIPGEGVVNTSIYRKSYPEVTGYYIPTLIRWGYRELAIQYTDFLIDIQKEDGSWYDTEDNLPYVFDTGQILKGLVAIYDIYEDKEKLKNATLKGADWLLSNMTDEGRLKAPYDVWEDGKTMSELIHIYCLSPLVEISKLYGDVTYKEKAEKILKYYIENHLEKILDFHLLSHFYAYVMEGLLDMGKNDIVKKVMDKVATLQSEDGAVPAYKDVHWVCSTGLFQLSLVWFRLEDLDNANKAFEFACKLQNDSGGWFGSYIVDYKYKENNTYLPESEISWANKYFLDALYYKNLSQFEKQSSTFNESIYKKDGRYIAILNSIKKVKNINNKKSLKILDIGCGKGNYLRNLLSDLPENKYYGIDISLKVMKYFKDLDIETKQGTLTNIPYSDNYFDIVYTCEALEHAIDIKNAIREMARVTKDNGQILIIDKDKDKLGYFEIEEWEQWFDKEELKKIMGNYCLDVTCKENISFEEKENESLFCLWSGKVNKKSN